MYIVLGGLIGLSIVVGVQMWLGASGHSPVWLLALSLLLRTFTTLTTRFAVTYNLLAEGWANRRFGRAAFYTLVAPVLLYSVLLLVPFFAGRWIWR